MARKKKEMMSTDGDRRRFGRRMYVAAVCAAAVAALLLAAHLREARSQQARPDLAADALPQLNLLGRHKAEVAEYATQIKARYAPDSAEYVEARRRYEDVAAKYDALIDTLSVSVKENSGGRRVAALREQSRLAAEAADSFADWVDGLLQLLSRPRRSAGGSSKGTVAADAATVLASAYGQREERVKERIVELMKELVRLKPWDEVPPVTTTTDRESSAPSTAPTP